VVFSDYVSLIVLGLLELYARIVNVLVWLVFLLVVTNWNPLHQVVEGWFELDNLMSLFNHVYWSVRFFSTSLVSKLY